MASNIPALPQSFTPGTDSVFSDQSGFFSLDSNVPGLSKVILDKLNMKDYGEYRYALTLSGRPQVQILSTSASDRAAVEGKLRGFSFRNYKEMFQKMEETFKFCTSCNRLPEHLAKGQVLKRCVK